MSIEQDLEFWHIEEDIRYFKAKIELSMRSLPPLAAERARMYLVLLTQARDELVLKHPRTGAETFMPKMTNEARIEFVKHALNSGQEQALIDFAVHYIQDRLEHLARQPPMPLGKTAQQVNEAIEIIMQFLRDNGQTQQLARLEGQYKAMRILEGEPSS